jgi:hypothetical protein
VDNTESSPTPAWLGTYEAKLGAIAAAVDDLVRHLQFIPSPWTEEDTHLLLGWRANHFGLNYEEAGNNAIHAAAKSAAERVRDHLGALMPAFQQALHTLETACGSEARR